MLTLTKYAKVIATVLCLILLGALPGCASGEVSKTKSADVPAAREEAADVKAENDNSSTDATAQKEMESSDMNTIKLTINNQVLTADLEDNSSADALLELLDAGPLTINMSDYGNMEKVGDIGTKLPTNDKQIKTKAGDLILYMGNSFVIYYDKNSWSLTRLGRIRDITAAELKKILGGGHVEVTLSK